MRTRILAVVMVLLAFGGTAWAAYARVFVWFDSSPTGIFDPSLLYPPGADVGWMAYSGVDYHTEPSGLVREVTTRLAASDDGGRTWVKHAQINVKEPGYVTGIHAQLLCGASRCDGYWIHEVPFLVDDPGDSARRFKLYTHRYFLYPPLWQTGGDTVYSYGTIRLRAASTPQGLASAPEENAFRWEATPPEAGLGGTDVRSLGGPMPSCIAVSEGSGKAIFGQLYVAFACTFESAPGEHRQQIVLLRSFDHGQSWHWLSTPLDVTDATALGASHYSAVDLFFARGAAWLSATPVTSEGAYAGCDVFLFDDLANGHLWESGGVPVPVYRIPTEDGRVGGACSFDEGVATGMLMSQIEQNVTDPFRIFDTGVRP